MAEIAGFWKTGDFGAADRPVDTQIGNRRRPQAPTVVPTSVTPKIAAFSEAAIFGPGAMCRYKGQDQPRPWSGA